MNKNYGKMYLIIEKKSYMNMLKSYANSFLQNFFKFLLTLEQSATGTS